MRAPDGLAGRLDGGDGVVNALSPVRGGPDDNDAQAGHLVLANAIAASAGHHGHSSPRGDGTDNLVVGRAGMTEDTAPGLDSHRYRCCGNGVVSNVAEWIGWRLRDYIEAQR
jgi:hypothetical protein